MTVVSAALAAMALTTLGAEDCSRLESSHQALLKGSFTCERHLTVRLNGDLKLREVTRLDYTGGELTREFLEREVLDDSLVLEEGAGESALELPFACERFEQLGDGVFELRSSDETEKVLFVRHPTSGALQPTSWINNETKRFLWKKFVIEALAEYKSFEWR